MVIKPQPENFGKIKKKESFNITYAISNNIETREISKEFYLPPKFIKVPSTEYEEIGRKLDTGIEFLRDIKEDTSIIKSIKEDTSALPEIKDTLHGVKDTLNGMKDTLHGMKDILKDISEKI